MLCLLLTLGLCGIAETARISVTHNKSRGLDPEDCNPHTTCEACAAETSWLGSCRWCGAAYDMKRDTYGKCMGYGEFEDFDSPICDDDSAIFDEPSECSACRNIIVGEFGLPRFWDPHDNPPATCTDRASASQCDNRQTKAKCSKACGIYSRNEEDPYQCPALSTKARSHVQKIHDLKPQVYDVLFVTEGGSLKVNLSHAIIRATSGGEYSHALIISQVSPKLMVLEAVSNVEDHEPSGLREVALEYAFAHVTKWELMRKRTECGLEYPDGHARRPEGQREDGMEWARKRTNIVKNGRGVENTRGEKAWAKAYGSVDSFLSVGFTYPNHKGYNDDPNSEPDAMYCSQVVAYILYRQGCAFHSGSNLNVDPWEMYKDLGWSYNYRVVYYSDRATHNIAKTETLEGMRYQIADDDFDATVCAHAETELDCFAVEKPLCMWLLDGCVPSVALSRRERGTRVLDRWNVG